MFFVYVIESLKDRSSYVGFTSNTEERIKEHNRGLNRYTKSRRPWEYVYYEACLNKKDAERREVYLKTTQGRRMLKLRLREYFKNN